MAGGLLNIISTGNNNLFLTGNPSKTFFKVTYSKHSNFGLQKFRIDYDGLRDLRSSEPSTFKFKIPRHADLLMDTYLVVRMPDIWSPIYPASTETNNNWSPYEFKWIKNLGAQLIKEIVITCGSLTLQKYTGEYMAAMVDRDFSGDKKELYNRMTGNIPDLNDPAYAFGRKNAYPNSPYTTSNLGAEPSIRGRNLYIPINTWFTLNSQCAFPLVALQYSELEISVTIRPIYELFTVRDVLDIGNSYPYIQPDFNLPRFQMHRFLQTPPSLKLNKYAELGNLINTWNADIHLLSTYCFLSKEETKLFTSQDQVYIVKDVFEHKQENITGTKKVQINSNGMIANWMWYLQRNDVNLRNEWSNYTNWPYHRLPSNVTLASHTNIPGETISYGIHPQTNQNTGITISGDFHNENRKEILETMGILFNGEYRENILTRGVYDYVEKYVRTSGNGGDGLYCYNFGLKTSPFEYQPSGAVNMSKFNRVELEITTHVPSVDTISSSYNVICGDDGAIEGIDKTNWRLYEYNYNLVLYEERYNILSFIGGNCGMMYSR
tara:strand:- start:6122 stop:7768 length:1647 start_codon:yes stop_codon:yes gene_type:complete